MKKAKEALTLNLLHEVKRIKGIISRKEKAFCYSIDTIQKHKEKDTVVIKGWGFYKLDNSCLNYLMLDTVGEYATIVRKAREDVNDLFDIDKKEQLGFEIKIQGPKTEDIIRLILKASDGTILPIKIDKKMLGKFKTGGAIINAVKVLKTEGIKKGSKRILTQKNNMWNEYDLWIYENESKMDAEKELMAFDKNPKISIVVPVYNVDEKWLRVNIESIRAQYYQNWELCMADDCSPSPHIKKVLTEYMEKDSRIKAFFREENGHISRATNSAINIATGDYIAFMDNDDELPPTTLYEYVKLINAHADADFIYCDEDMIDTTGRRFNAFFKSSWNPVLLLGHNYITHFVMVSRDLMDRTGLLNPEVNGAQDYDFILRATEKAKGIYHIPKILYHWRTIEGSVADDPEAKNYAYVAGKKSVEDALMRRCISGNVAIGNEYGTYDVNYTYPETPKVSIVFLNDSLTNSEYNQKLKLLLEKTDYPNFEIIVINCEPEYDFDERVHFVYNNANRTIQQLKNYSAKKARGEYLVFLDTFVTPKKSNWLEKMLEFAMKPEIGVVGNKVFDKENHIYNAGVWFSEDHKKVHYTHRGCNSDNIGYYYRLTLPQLCFAVTDDCLMLSTADFDQVGGFDVALNKVLAAVDLCVKLRNIQKQIVWTPYSEVETEVTGEKAEITLTAQELKQLEKKWKPLDFNDPYTNPYVIEQNI